MPDYRLSLLAAAGISLPQGCGEAFIYQVESGGDGLKLAVSIRSALALVVRTEGYP